MWMRAARPLVCDPFCVGTTQISRAYKPRETTCVFDPLSLIVQSVLGCIGILLSISPPPHHTLAVHSALSHRIPTSPLTLSSSSRFAAEEKKGGQQTTLGINRSRAPKHSSILLPPPSSSPPSTFLLVLPFSSTFHSLLSRSSSPCPWSLVPTLPDRSSRRAPPARCTVSLFFLLKHALMQPSPHFFASANRACVCPKCGYPGAVSVVTSH